MYKVLGCKVKRIGKEIEESIGTCIEESEHVYWHNEENEELRIAFD